MAAKNGNTKRLTDMEVGTAMIEFDAKTVQSFMQIASRLKKANKGTWRVEKQPTGNYLIWRDA